MATESKEPQNETVSGMAPMVKQIAEMVRVYYQGLGEEMPMALREQMTKDFAAEINRAMGARIAKGSDAGSG